MYVYNELYIIIIPYNWFIILYYVESIQYIESICSFLKVK